MMATVPEEITVKLKVDASVLKQYRALVLEEAAQTCEAQIQVFSSERYAVNQPSSSIGERFACVTIAATLRAMK